MKAEALVHYQLKNDTLDSIHNNHGTIIGKSEFTNEDPIPGVIFNEGNVMIVPKIELKGSYSITTWFETPLPWDVPYYNSLCGGGTIASDLPVIIQRSNSHLGAWNSRAGNIGFVDSGFDMTSLENGKHFLVVIVDDDKDLTNYYIDDNEAGSINFKPCVNIDQIGNNGNSSGYDQQFGFVGDFRVYNKKLDRSEMAQLYNEISHKIQKISLISPTSENAIEVKNLTKVFRIYHERRNTLFDKISAVFNHQKYYEKLVVLDDISFEVKKGEMIGIIGLNGSGKTTLLRLLARIMQPDMGKITINGRLTPLLELGTGFQPELTARDNIILYGMILGLTKKEIKSKIQSIMEFSGLQKFLDTKLKSFSSGMYSKLAFSVAMHIDPEILLVDEVLSVGDLPFRKKSYNAFVSFRKRGKSIVFVSHDLNTVQNLCDRAIFLNRGKIQSIGKPSAVIKEYVKIESVKS